MNVIKWSAVALAVSALGFLLSLLTGALRRRFEAAGGDNIAVPDPVPLDPVPPQETAGYHFARVINGGGLLGVLMLPVLIGFAPQNATLLAEGFAVLLGQAPTPMGQLSIFGFDTPITNFFLYGMSLTLALAVLGAAYAEFCRTRSPGRWLALGGVLGIIVFETIISGIRGYDLADELGTSVFPMVAANAASALLYASSEAISGYFSVHCLLLPLLQGLSWLIAAPFRSISRHLRHRQSDPWLTSRVVTRFDREIFDPLRSLDSFGGALLKRVARTLHLLSVVLLIATSLGCTHASPAPAAQPLRTWFVFIDNSKSVPEEQFAQYPALVSDSVLRFLQPGDQVVVRSLFGQTAPSSRTLEGRTRQQRDTLRRLTEDIKAIKISANAQAVTDLGRFLTEASESISRTIAIGAKGREFVVVMVTDGIITGKPTLPAKPFKSDADWHLLVLGVARGAQGDLKTLCAKVGFEGDHLMIVPWDQVPQTMPFIHTFLGRTPNLNTRAAWQQLANNK